MEPMLDHAGLTQSPTPGGLPPDRTAWPDEASDAFVRLLGDLDLWSREHGWTQSGNAWIAEEAVRRGWE